MKYEVVAAFADRVLKMTSEGVPIGGYRITSVNSINGVRIRTEDGTWGLVRASSNKSELVVVVESPVSEQRLHQMFQALDQLLREDERVGKYNQSI